MELDTEVEGLTDDDGLLDTELLTDEDTELLTDVLGETEDDGE